MLDVFDHRICGLGEGVLWHAEREELFWVDIPERRVLCAGIAGQREHRFEEMVSALGIIDREHLLLASESGLHKLAIADWSRELLVGIEADDADTRSNDGRTDPWGGFWIGTMSKSAQDGAGKIYRYYKGELRVLIDSISIPNGHCFDRQRSLAYLTDSKSRQTWRIPLDDDGWPCGEREIFLDNDASGVTIDGAIVDRHGNLFCAIYNGGAVWKMSPDGEMLEELSANTPLTTCPAFGGPNWSDLFVTTGAIGLDPADADAIQHGVTLRFSGCVEGVNEPIFGSAIMAR